MHPAELGAHGEDFAEQQAGLRPVEEHAGLGGGAREGLGGVADGDGGFLGKGGQFLELRIGRIRQHEDCDIVHVEKATTCSISRWKYFAWWKRRPSPPRAQWEWVTLKRRTMRRFR
jgi:hypothetical protein